MKDVYFQIVHALKCIFKDTKSLVSKLLTFAIVILVLGSAFKDAFDAEDLESVRVGLLNQDEGPVSEEIIRLLRDNEDVSQWVELVEVESFEEGQRLAGDSDVDEEDRIGAMLQIPENFSQDYEKNLSDDVSNTVKIWYGQTSQMDSTVIKCVFDTLASYWNVSQVLMDPNDMEADEEINLDDGIQDWPMDADETPDAMSYYAIAMLMMVLLYGAEYGCNAVAEDYLGVIGERVKTTPFKPWKLYSGKLIGACLASTLQGVFIVLLTLLYGANWGSNYLFLLLIIFSMSCASTALGALLCMLFQDGSKGQSFVSLLVIACTFLAGGFVKMDMGTLKFISPNYYAQTAVFNTAYGGELSIALLNIGILWAFVIAASAVALLLSRRKRA